MPLVPPTSGIRHYCLEHKPTILMANGRLPAWRAIGAPPAAPQAGSSEKPHETTRLQSVRRPMADSLRFYAGGRLQPAPVDQLRANHQQRRRVLPRLRPEHRPVVGELHGGLPGRVHSGLVGDRHLRLSRGGGHRRRADRHLRVDARPGGWELRARAHRADRHRHWPALHPQRGDQGGRAGSRSRSGPPPPGLGRWPSTWASWWAWC
jgi:hypothetical protein